MNTQLHKLFKQVKTVFYLSILTMGALNAQTNIAPDATISSSTCSNCQLLNDLNFGTCGTVRTWITTGFPAPSNTAGVEFIQWEWPTTQVFDQLIIHHGNNVTAQFLTGATIQYWDGSAWVTHHTFSGLPLQCQNTITFNPIASTRVRITLLKVAINTQGNPTFRQMEIMSVPPAVDDAGVLSIDSPATFCPGDNPVVVTVQNYGENVVDSVRVNWTLNGVAQPTYYLQNPLDTANGSNPITASVNLGTRTFTAGQDYTIKVWTSHPNGQIDPVNNNDTLEVIRKSALSGNFTLNANQAASASNYVSFTSLKDDLHTRGVCGPVVVNVQQGSGPYQERIELEEIPGTSEQNTITINGNGETLEYLSQNNEDRATLTFNGTDWVTIDDLRIRTMSGTRGWVLFMTNAADHNTFRNCTFQTNTTSFSILFCNVVMSASVTSPNTGGNTGSYNLFENNTHIGGAYGFSMVGASSSAKNKGNRIINSTFTNFATNGLYIVSQDSLVVEGNRINRSSRTEPAVTPIYLGGGMTNARILSNRIYNLFNSNLNSNHISNGIHLNGAGGAAGQENIMANNAMYNIVHGGVLYGIYLQGGSNDYWKIYHNTIALESPNNTASVNTRALYCTGSQGNISIKNNIFYSNRKDATQYLLYFSEASSTPEIDYNAYYIPDINSSAQSRMAYFGEDVDNFNDWRETKDSLFDKNGRFTRILFSNVNSGNLQPILASINDMGVDLTNEIPTDILGETRSQTPDPGAWEFNPFTSGIDIEILDFLSPSSGMCPDSAEVIVEITNNGMEDTAYTLYVSWSVNGQLQNPVQINDTFYPGGAIPVMIGKFDVFIGGVYDLEVYIDSIADGIDVNPLNDTIRIDGITPGLSGNYTIDPTLIPSHTNFITFADFTEKLSQGVCGPVVVDVQPGSGPFNEQVRITRIPNASETNTVTINGHGEILTFSSTNTNARYTLALQEAKYVIIDSLNIHATATGNQNFGWGIWLSSGSDYNTIRNCSIRIDDTGPTPNYVGIVMSSSSSFQINGDAVAGNYNTIENNTITGGMYGIICMGKDQNDQGVRNTFQNNEIRDFREYAFYIQAQDSLVVDANNIHRPSRTTLNNFYGIYLTGEHTNARVSNNRIHSSFNQNPGAFGQYGIYILNTSLGGTQTENLLYNNMLYKFNSYGPFDGIRLDNNTNYWKIYHNTLVFDEQNSGTTRGIIVGSNAQATEIKNNIIFINRGGGSQTGIAFTGSNQPISDYNGIRMQNLGTQDVRVGMIGTTSYVSPQDWKAQGFDDNSIFSFPFFTDAANQDYRPASQHYDEAGADLISIVPVDIEGVTRTTPPDLGALQFTPLFCLGIIDITVDSIHPDRIVLSWESDENNWEIEWGSIGFTPGSGLGTVVSQVDTNSGFVLTNIPINTCVELYIREICSNDSSEWGGPVQFCTPFGYDIRVTELISPANDDCGDSLIAVHAAIQNHGFFPADSFAVDVQIGSPVNALVSVNYTGSLAPGERDTVLVGHFSHISGGSLNISAYTKWVLDQNVHNDTLNTIRTIQDVAPIPVFASEDTICEQQNVSLWIDPAFSGSSIEWFDGANSLGSSDTILLSNMNQTTHIRLVHQVQSGCPRMTAEKSIVKISPPQAAFTNNHQVVTADFSGFTVHFDASGSDYGHTYSWDFGDGGTYSSQQDSANHTYTSNGTYTVELIISNQCGTDTIRDTIMVWGISTRNYMLTDVVSIFPNPNNGHFTLQINPTVNRLMNMELIDGTGKIIWSDTRMIDGLFQREFQLNLSNGLYIIRLNDGHHFTTKRIIIQN